MFHPLNQNWIHHCLVGSIILVNFYLCTCCTPNLILELTPFYLHVRVIYTSIQEIFPKTTALNVQYTYDVMNTEHLHTLMNTYYSKSSNIQIVFATNYRIPKNHYYPNPNLSCHQLINHYLPKVGSGLWRDPTFFTFNYKKY